MVPRWCLSPFIPAATTKDRCIPRHCTESHMLWFESGLEGLCVKMLDSCCWHCWEAIRSEKCLVCQWILRLPLNGVLGWSAKSEKVVTIAWLRSVHLILRPPLSIPVFPPLPSVSLVPMKSAVFSSIPNFYHDFLYFYRPRDSTPNQLQTETAKVLCPSESSVSGAYTLPPPPTLVNSSSRVFLPQQKTGKSNTWDSGRGKQERRPIHVPWSEALHGSWDPWDFFSPHAPQTWQ